MPTYTRRTARLAGVAVAVAVALAPAAAPIADAHPRSHPDSYMLAGDEQGLKFEGIGYDRRSHFYVSETTGGEIHRGSIGRPQTHQWLDGDGTDGRYTARGINVDRKGRVFIAGGPNSTMQPGAPDMWVYSSSGRLLAGLSTGLADVMINDVAIGRDGSAYFTDSTKPQVFRVWQNRRGWHVEVWKDASATIRQMGGFNLNGIVATPDGKALLIVQSNAAKLWRFDLRTRNVTEVVVTGANLASGDGLVLRGHRLSVVRNFPQRLTTVRLSEHWRRAWLHSELRTDPERVLTTAKIARGRLLAVDSKFDEAVPAPPYQVVVLPVP